MEPDKIDTNECMCCICYEKDIYYSMIHCNICVEGNVCLECYDNNEFGDKYRYKETKSIHHIRICSGICRSNSVYKNH